MTSKTILSYGSHECFCSQDVLFSGEDWHLLKVLKFVTSLAHGDSLLFNKPLSQDTHRKIR